MEHASQENLAENPLIRLYEEVINLGKLDVIDALYDDGYVNEVAPFGLSQGVHRLRGLFVEFMNGIPATGRKIHMEGVDIEHFHDGRISRHWDVEDQLALLGQIDAIH